MMLRKACGLLSLFLCTTSSFFGLSVQFAGRVDIPTHSQHLTGLAVADFNGDGKLDIAVTDDYTQTVAVYLNDGTGKFEAPVTTTLNLPSIGGLGALVAGDVNEDGKQDLIVGPVAGIQNDVVLLGNGDGTFTQGERIPGSNGFFNAALLDINGDKHLDLISGGNGDVYVQLGDGKGNFTQQPVISSGLYIGLTDGDFTGNKHIDFVAADYTGNALDYFAGDGDGTFQVPTKLTGPAIVSPSSLVSADFNGDGKLDLVVGSGDIAALMFGNGDGTFQTGASQIVLLGLPPSTMLPPTYPAGTLVATADMDGNGSADVVAADEGSEMLSVILNDGTGKFPQLQPDFTAALDAGNAALRLADLNGDGLPDVIVTNYKTQNISIFLSIVQKTQPVVTVQSSTAQTLAGSTVLITVQVTGTGSATPSGTVTLASGAASFGQQTLNASGQAMFTLQGLGAGQYPLSASYSGDTRYDAATSVTSFVQAITDFQLTLPTATQSVAAGSSATYPISLNPIAGLTGTAVLTCSGLPAGYSCAPLSVTVSGQETTANVVVSPPALSAGVGERRPVVPFGRTVGICTALCLWFAIGKRRRLASLVVLALCCVGAVSGCSGGSGASKPVPYTGTSSFTIAASVTDGPQTVSHSVSATLTVH